LDPGELITTRRTTRVAFPGPKTTKVALLVTDNVDVSRGEVVSVDITGVALDDLEVGAI